MKKRIQKIGRRLLVFLVLPLVLAPGARCAADPLDELRVDRLNTFEEMKTALSTIEAGAANAVERDAFTSGFQKKILAEAGKCISRLAYLSRTSTDNPDTVRRAGKALFLTNGDIIRHILTTNEQKVAHFQEVVLDTLEDPLAFFQTSRWQDPQQLISLSSYWLGWNGYYASLVIPEGDPERLGMLQEAVDGFSRAFIDFEEEAVILKSLYGRGLCYRQLKDFQNALYDFKAVKDRIKNDDSLLARCLYEEASISYETGNFRLALGKLDQIQELPARDGIPESLVAGMAELRANVLLSQLEKTAEQTGGGADAVDDDHLSAFHEMKQLALQQGRINESFYRYVQANADGLAHLPYGEMGPVAAMAVGDWYYGNEEYDRALSYYNALLSDINLPFSQNLDRLKYRTAYIFFKKRQWREVVKLLEGFHEDFSESWLTKEAGTLYYTAASKQYGENGESDAYETYIRAIQVYLAVCDSCDGRSEARFQLGGHYRKTGQHHRAVNEFSTVGEDSPNFFQAKYYVLESHLDELDMLSKKGHTYAEERMRIYRKGLGVIDECRRAAPNEKAAAGRETLQPYMAVLQAKFHLHGGADDWEKGFQLVRGFEKQYPNQNALFADAIKLRIEYGVMLQREKVFETEIDGFMGATPVDPSRYAELHDLANSFYTKSKRTTDETEKDLQGRLAPAALAIYEKLHTISLEDAAYENYCEPIELRMAAICMNMNRIDQAAELYAKALGRNPRSADAVYGLGLIYEQQEKWGEALQTWRKFSDGVAAGTYHWFQSRYRTAVALHQLGETERACTVATMTRVLHPDFGDNDLERKFLELESNLCKGETAQ